MQDVNNHDVQAQDSHEKWYWLNPARVIVESVSALRHSKLCNISDS